VLKLVDNRKLTSSIQLLTRRKNMPFDGINYGLSTWQDNVYDYLRAAKTVIEHKSCWCTGNTETLDGRYCSLGALELVYNLDLGFSKSTKLKAIDVLSEIISTCGTRFPLMGHIDRITTMNDYNDHFTVMGHWDEAILKAKGGMVT
jgi:hypothetical protein